MEEPAVQYEEERSNLIILQVVVSDQFPSLFRLVSGGGLGLGPDLRERERGGGELI
jgi:hypothetical protein